MDWEEEAPDAVDVQPAHAPEDRSIHARRNAFPWGSLVVGAIGVAIVMTAIAVFTVPLCMSIR